MIGFEEKDSPARRSGSGAELASEAGMGVWERERDWSDLCVVVSMRRIAGGCRSLRIKKGRTAACEKKY
jgi:hypothetical protein